MGLDVWFPLAIYYEDLADTAPHNEALLARVHELMLVSGAQRTASFASWTGDVHDVDRIHFDPSFEWVTEQVGIHAFRYLTILGHDLEKIDIHIQRSWPVVARRDQNVSRHTHYNAHLTAVYYVNAPAGENAGQIKFFNDSRQNELSAGIGSSMTQGYAASNELNYQSVAYNPVAGRMILFPSRQPHSVDANRSEHERVSLVFDMVITSRGRPGEGRYEFLMPAPSAWRKIDRFAGGAATERTPLGSLTRYRHEFDRFSVPQTAGHPLWQPVLLADCLSSSAVDDHARRLATVVEADWLWDASGKVRTWTGCRDWLSFRDAGSRIYVHLRDHRIPLEAASVTNPVVQRRDGGNPPPFERGTAHLCVYLRLDNGHQDCRLELADGECLAIPSGGVVIVPGCRRHRLVGAADLLHFQLDLPAAARADDLARPELQSLELTDSIVFAAITAEPIGMAMPSTTALAEKLDWNRRRAQRRYRHEECPAVRRYLLEHADPQTATPPDLALIQEHGLSGGAPSGRLLRPQAVIDKRQCEALRRFADIHMTSVVPDSVDDLPEYQVNLSEEDLCDLLGKERASALLRLPEAICLPGQSLERVDIFIRKYSPETRPYLSFHADICSYTASIALNDSDDFSGGKLLALHDGALRDITCGAGDAAVYGGNLVHGVTRIEGGVRHTLILFYHYTSVPR